MDRNQFIGLILMFAVLAVYFTWFAPDPPAPVEETTEELAPAQDTNPQLQSQLVEPEVVEEVSDSLKNAQNYAAYGAFAFAISESDETQVIETEDLRITFGSKGGNIKEVEILKHKDQFGNSFKIMDAAKSRINMIVDSQGKSIDLSDLSYSGTLDSKPDTTVVSYIAESGSISIEHRFPQCS